MGGRSKTSKSGAQKKFMEKGCLRRRRLLFFARAVDRLDFIVTISVLDDRQMTNPAFIVLYGSIVHDRAIEPDHDSSAGWAVHHDMDSCDFS